MTTVALYETDLYAWAIRNARLLRERCADELDFEHLALPAQCPYTLEQILDSTFYP